MKRIMKKNRIIKIIAITILFMSALALGAMKKWRILPLVVIHGKVTDEAGKPIENADVAARYGITYDAPNVRTSPTGSFTVMVFAFQGENSGKGPPSITVTKRGYRQYWGYFSKERFGGLVFRRVSVRLLAGSEEPPIREDF
jgi:hypothetical protein